MDHPLTKTGIVIAADRGAVTVAVSDGNDCVECGIKSLCNHNSGQGTIAVLTDTPDKFTIGDKVEITVSGHIQGQALLTGIVYPCILLVITIASTLCAGCSQTLSAFIALGAIGIYYTLLYLMRNRVERNIKWDIHKIENNKNNSDTLL